MQSNFILTENRYQQKIMIDPQDLVGKGILKDGLYDKTGLYFIEEILSRLNQPIVFDVGANVGNHALRMSQFSKMVYLFEPQNKIVSQLNTTMDMNKLSNWKVFNFGLSDQSARLPLYSVDGHNCKNSFVSESNNSLEQEAQVFVGDDVVQENKIEQIDLIKIDVEGFEAKVIMGLKQSIQKFRPIIFMEWDKEITKQQFAEHQLFQTIFDNYLFKAITRNPAESNFVKKIFGKLTRILNKTKKRKRMIIGSFDSQKNYRHIVLIPKEKAQLLEGLT